MMLQSPSFDFPPYRLSGVVYGCLLNDKAGLLALGDAVDKAPYRGAPKAPVLFMKPRNTLALSGASVVVDETTGVLAIGASLGIVMGSSAARITVDGAKACIAGLMLVADLSVPHASFYRPSIRMKARDGSCLLGSVMPYAEAITLDFGLEISVSIDGAVVKRISPEDMVRPMTRLIADISDFLTLDPGDVVLFGSTTPLPTARAGQTFAIEAAALGRLQGSLVAPADRRAA
jgi:5-oxopent-3-ene-1,2,5-tricarboxylate decarboxylase / 2-hydroxyhepta-2,4-diene-1,7-dioate isomerase